MSLMGFSMKFGGDCISIQILHILWLLECLRPDQTRPAILKINNAYQNLLLAALHKSQKWQIRVIIEMSERDNLIVNYEKYESNFSQAAATIANEPCQERRCTDVGCVVIFLLLTLGFFGVGVYEIIEYNKLPVLNHLGQEREQLELLKYGGIVAAGVGTSIIVAFLYVFLIKACVRVMIYTMIALSLGLLAVFTAYGLITGNLGLAIGCGVTLLIYLLVLFCMRNKIKTGIALVQVAANFITEKMYIFVTPLIKLILTAIMGSFYAYAFSCVIALMNDKQAQGKDDSTEVGFTVFFSFIWLFYIFIFYYMMTFTIAVVCAHWYYGVEGRSSLGTAYKWLFTRQFGSIVFASFVISVVTLVRMLVQNERRNNDDNNLVVKCCLCIIECILKAIEDLLQVLNSFSVIMMAVTGEGYIDSAKTTMGLLWKELGLLYIANMICSFLVFWGLILSVGIPVVLTIVIMKLSHDSNHDIASVTGIVAVISVLFSVVVFEIVSESVSCTFIFYALDKEFMERGIIQSHRIPQTYEQMNRYSQDYGNNPYSNQGFDNTKNPYSNQGFDNTKNPYQ